MEKEEIIYLSENKMRLGKLEKTQIVVTIVSIILGTILHFTYEVLEENIVVGAFSAVNESVWEHLKLIFFPMLIVAIIEYFIVNKISKNYLEAKVIGIFTAISFTIVAFFTYTGIIGTNFLIVDILIFIASIILGELVAYRLMKRKNESNTKTKILAGLIIVFLFICFILLTYFTPHVNLFRDPITGTYGIFKS